MEALDGAQSWYGSEDEGHTRGFTEATQGDLGRVELIQQNTMGSKRGQVWGRDWVGRPSPFYVSPSEIVDLNVR